LVPEDFTRGVGAAQAFSALGHRGLVNYFNHITRTIMAQNDPIETNRPDNALATGNAGVERPARCGAPTKSGGSCRAAAIGPGGRCGIHPLDPERHREMVAAQAEGGLHPKLSFGLPDMDAAALDLSTSEGRRAVLTAIASALARGRTTAATANAMAGVVRAAAEEQVAKLQRALDEALAYAHDLEQQLGATTTARGRR
jgi:hypothetical protein